MKVAAHLILLCVMVPCVAQDNGNQRLPRRPPSREQVERAISESANTESVNPFLLGALLETPLPLELPPQDGAWLVQLISRGGLLGTGSGDLTVTSAGDVIVMRARGSCGDRASSETTRRIGEAIAAAKPSVWVSPAGNYCYDCYITALILSQREADGSLRSYSVYWDDSTLAKLPLDVRQLYAATRAIMETETLNCTR